MKQAFIYCRVSTEEQAETGKSIETQERLCRKWAKENGVKVIQTFIDEGKSATNLNRPALKDLLSNVQDKTVRVNFVLVQDTDRLARNTLDHLTIKSILTKRSVQLISISQPMIDDSPEGNLIDTIIASVNAFQSQITGRKTSKVLEEKAKLGWYPGGVPPLGYINADNPNPTCTFDRRIVIIDQDTARAIRKLFEAYVSGNFSFSELALRLRESNISSPYKNNIHKSLIQRILTNEFYNGYFYWKGKRYLGKHDLFITPELFKNAQQRILAGTFTRKRKNNYLLSGYLFCSTCGKRIWGETHIKKTEHIYSFYFCPEHKNYAPTDETEVQVERLFQKIQLSEDYVNSIRLKAMEIIKESRRDVDSDKRSLEKQKTEVEKGMKEAEDSRFIRRSLSEERFTKIYKRYEDSLSNIEEQLASIKIDYGSKLATLEKTLTLAENIGQAYKNADFLTKRSYLNLFFKKIYLDGQKVRQYKLNPELEGLIKQGMVRVRPNGRG